MVNPKVFAALKYCCSEAFSTTTMLNMNTIVASIVLGLNSVVASGHR